VCCPLVGRSGSCRCLVCLLFARRDLRLAVLGKEEREANKIGRLDPETGKIDKFPTPGLDIPRRMGADWEGNIWVGFHETSKLVKIDQKYGTMTYYNPPTPNNGAYHVVTDPRTKMI
jgi:streptogramin lyase